MNKRPQPCDSPDTQEFSFARESKRFRKTEAELERSEMVSCLLRRTRVAAEAADDAALRKCFVQASAYLTPPRLGGDGGHDVSTQEVEETRNVKRSLLICLEKLAHQKEKDAGRFPECAAAYTHIQALLDGVSFADGAKGVQQWLRIRDLTASATEVPGTVVTTAAAVAKETSDGDEVSQGGARVFALERQQFLDVESAVERSEVVASVLRGARDAAERADRTALQKCFFQASACVRPPRPAGDGGPGVSAQEMEETRSLRRALLICLEAFSKQSEENVGGIPEYAAALAYLQALLDGVSFTPGAKGVQQWLRIRELAAMVGPSCDACQVAEGEAACTDDLGDHESEPWCMQDIDFDVDMVGELRTEAKKKQSRTGRAPVRPAADEDIWGVPALIATLVRRSMKQLGGEGTVTDIVRMAQRDPSIWEGLDVASLNRYPVMSGWTIGRPAWENFVARKTRYICKATDRHRGRARIWKLPEI
eukprot:TRINITY_DN11158_c0_g2_i1.p1 TRINITY_DN11158_c0_g2~~TRINITY_DN11158_c0_g2_i1.p1  ORF type:complete len:480 (+),score=70.67 TRINITY_DN11158_c0_g2_i1:180-1619(+)